MGTTRIRNWQPRLGSGGQKGNYRYSYSVYPTASGAGGGYISISLPGQGVLRVDSGAYVTANGGSGENGVNSNSYYGKFSGGGGGAGGSIFVLAYRLLGSGKFLVDGGNGGKAGIRYGSVMNAGGGGSGGYISMWVRHVPSPDPRPPCGSPGTGLLSRLRRLSGVLGFGAGSSSSPSSTSGAANASVGSDGTLNTQARHKAGAWSTPKGADVSVKSATRPPSSPGLATRLRAGVYGGAFSLSSNHTSIGTIWALGCALDGSHVSDLSGM